MTLETYETYKTVVEDNIHELVGSLAHHSDPHNDELNCSSPDSYFVFESRDVTVGELQNALKEIAAIVQAKAALMSTEEALTLGRVL